MKGRYHTLHDKFCGHLFFDYVGPREKWCFFFTSGEQQYFLWEYQYNIQQISDLIGPVIIPAGGLKRENKYSLQSQMRWANMQNYQVAAQLNGTVWLQYMYLSAAGGSLLSWCFLWFNLCQPQYLPGTERDNVRSEENKCNLFMLRWGAGGVGGLWWWWWWLGRGGGGLDLRG